MGSEKTPHKPLKKATAENGKTIGISVLVEEDSSRVIWTSNL